MEGKEISTPVMVAIIVVVIAIAGGLWWHFGGSQNAAQANASTAPPPWIDPVTHRPKVAGANSSPGAPNMGDMMKRMHAPGSK